MNLWNSNIVVFFYKGLLVNCAHEIPHKQRAQSFHQSTLFSSSRKGVGAVPSQVFQIGPWLRRRRRRRQRQAQAAAEEAALRPRLRFARQEQGAGPPAPGDWVLSLLQQLAAVRSSGGSRGRRRSKSRAAAHRVGGSGAGGRIHDTVRSTAG